MAKQETDIVHEISIMASKNGGRLWKNVRGVFYTKFSVIVLIKAAKTFNLTAILKAVRELRQVKAGLMVNDSSDLIGYRPVLITTEMVGKTLAVFAAIEVKTAKGSVQKGQEAFTGFIVNNGGYAGIARCVEDAKKILNY